MEWIANNLGALIAAVVAGLGLVATWVLYGADIRQLKKDMTRLQAELTQAEALVNKHHSDTTLHIDPHRDEKRWDDLKSEIFRRFDGMESKIEKLMIIHPPGPLA